MAWEDDKPKNDDVYFERLCKAVFEAGLSWRLIDNKWSGFRKAFSGFSLQKVAKFDENDINSLMEDPGIVRSEKKIQATIFNAQEALKIKKEYGSMAAYIDSFHNKNDETMDDLRKRFHHVGPASARTFLLTIGSTLKPTEDEKIWIKNNLKPRK